MKSRSEVEAFDVWFEEIAARHPAPELDLIRRAYVLASRAHAEQKRSSGEPYILHCLAVAKLLSDLRMDSETLAAALLHDVPEDTEITMDEIRQEFGVAVARLVDGVTKLTQIEHLDGQKRRALHTLKEEAKAESLRKMFLAMLDDVRVVMIKLADRLHNMRTLGSLPDAKRKRIARETLEIFAPLADRLGIWQFKTELEDLSLRHLEPKIYKEIASRLEEYHPDRDRHFEQVRQKIQTSLQEVGIQAEVFGRPRHIYSVYRAMTNNAVSRDQLYDIGDLRIVVNDVMACYQALGVVHTLWRPIPGEFDDYIATPKDNMYRSLHTAVVGPHGRRLTIKIRTSEMHKMAEFGIAAHWRYEGAQYDSDFDEKIAWLRQLMEWREEVADAHEFIASLKSDVFQDRVYTFTPRGDIIDLPQRATPIDFAYHIHTEVGHRCRGARVNGRLVSLDYQLSNGDQVEILTAKRGGPSRDWLNPYMGFVATSRARSKIRHWFKHLSRAEAIQEGRVQLDQELNRLGLTHLDREQLAAFFSYDRLDDFLYAVGVADITGYQIINRITQIRSNQDDGPASAPPPTLPAASPNTVQVSGSGKPPTRLARCCNPVPGDAITGYLTRRHGVTVHRQDCSNILNLANRDRLVDVHWVDHAPSTYSANIIIEAHDRPGLLRDISTVVASESINITSITVATRKEDNRASLTVTLDITDLDQLSRVLTRIGQLPSVVDARSLASTALAQLSQVLPQIGGLS